jgi:uncharacterized protein (TIGR02266 family)
LTQASATVVAARQGREALATALLSLQTAQIADAGIERAIEFTASASSALYAAEASSPTEEAAASFIHTAADALQRAMADVALLRPQHPALDVPAASLARTLALLYPVLQHTMRQRRGRRQLSDSDARELATMSAYPQAPEPTGRSRRPSGFEGRERRANTQRRVYIEVEIGLTTESHIYTGISLDVSEGGVFVSTYQPAAAGTAVTLYFVLPNGHVVNAEGVVRWTRAQTTDTAPGMGVAFVNISAESLDQIARFCASRPPLYFDDP